MERKKRSKGSVWEFCYANTIFGTFGFEMRECGQKACTMLAYLEIESLELRRIYLDLAVV